jgi:circadian clock protein KaiC
MTKIQSKGQTGTNGQLVVTGIEGLDAILGGGLPSDRLYLIQGDPGAGKTTLSLQFLIEGQRRGEKGLYFTLGETREELESAAHSHGWSLEGIHIIEISSGETEEELRTDESYDVFHPAEVELGQVMRTLVTEAKRVKPARVVIDSLSEVRLMAREPLAYRRQLLGIKRFFSAAGGTVLLLDAPDLKVGDLHANTLVNGIIRLDQSIPVFGLKRRQLSVAKLRGVRFDDGYHDFKIETGGLKVFPRLVAAEHSSPAPDEAMQSGIKGLDDLMGGGIPRGTSTLFLGAAGVGKSTLVAQYISAAAARGEHVAVFAFDENIDTFVGRGDCLGMEISQSIERGLLHVRQVDPGNLAPGEFAQYVRDAVEKDNCRMIVIDSLNGYLNATPGERFLIVQMHELLSYLANRGVATLVVVAQYGLLGNSVESTVDASYLADAVVMVRYFEHEGRVRKAISVVKKRTGTHESTIREFKISARGIEIGSPLQEFQGVLTGVPSYRGKAGDLIGGNDAHR